MVILLHPLLLVCLETRRTNLRILPGELAGGTVRNRPDPQILSLFRSRGLPPPVVFVPAAVPAPAALAGA